MSILGQVGQGTRKTGQRLVIAGQEKMGKTTLAMASPNPLLVPLETDNVALARYRNHVPPHLVGNWQGVIALCEELRTASQRGQLQSGSTIVWDSATALERLIHEHVIMTSPEAEGARKARQPIPPQLTMETAHGGFGKAYPKALDEFSRWLRYQDELCTYGGINIVTTCHVFASRVNDPAHGEFDTWDLLLHSPKNNKTYGKREFITQWADFIGFLHEPLFVMEADKGKSLSRGMSQGIGRVIAVDRTPQWVAGNRYGLTGTIAIPPQHGWNVLADAIYKNTGGAFDIYNRA